MKKLICILALCATSLAQAHGTPVANHGGIVQAVGETWLELVARGGAFELYVEDDGDPVASADLSGTLTIVDAGGKKQLALKPAGANKLQAAGAVGKGGKVLVLLQLADKKTHVSTTFQMK
jgi:hypothetical protein